MVCRVIIPQLTLRIFSSSFTSLFSRFQNKDGLQLFWCREGKNYPVFMFQLNRNVSSSSPIWCCFAFFFPISHKIFCPIHASGWGGGEVAKATHVLHGNFMWQRRRRRTTACQCSGSGGGHGFLLHLYSLPQTVTVSNGSERQRKRCGRGCRCWS